MAINAVKINEELIVSDALVLEDGDNLQLISRSAENRLYIFPEAERTINASAAEIKKEKSPYENFEAYSVRFEESTPEVKIEKVSNQKYTLQLNADISDLNDVFLEADYIGDRALAFIHGKLITDHFYQEKKWEIGLKSFASQLAGNKMTLLFHPMHVDYEYLKDLNHIPEFENGQFLKVNGFDIVPEYKTKLIY